MVRADFLTVLVRTPCFDSDGEDRQAVLLVYCGGDGNLLDKQFEGPCTVC